MTPYQKELFAIRLGVVAGMCEKMLKHPEDIPEGWRESIEDMKSRASLMSKKWEQVKE